MISKESMKTCQILPISKWSIVMGFLKTLAVCGASAIAPSAALADGIALTVQDDAGTHVALSLADLDALDQITFETSTIWTDQNVSFSGVPLSSVLKTAGTSGTILRMTALNDYAVDMPVGDIGDDFPIVATRMNGVEISVRDKGPYWIVYPYDADPAFQTETSYARSVWQLSTLSVMK